MKCEYANLRCTKCGQDVSKNHWAVCEFFPEHCPNDCPKGSIPRNRLMEHIRSECKVKKDGKQLPEMKSQRDNLLEKLRFLQDTLERRKGEMQDAGINREQELTTALDELQEELWKKDKKISEMAVELEEVQRKLHVSLEECPVILLKHHWWYVCHKGVSES